MKNFIRIAVQKSGRLKENSLALLRESGLVFANGTDQLKARVLNFPAELLFLRDDDIPQYVEDRVADVGIVGENVAAEKKKEVIIIKRLGFAKCRLSIAVPRTENYTGLLWLNGRRVATSYPEIARDFFIRNNVNTEIHEISGSVEIAPGIGLADAICDLVSSGSTLLSNGLKEVEVVMQSEAVLIGNKKLERARQDLLDKLIFRIESVKLAKNNKYILLNCPDDAVDNITAVIPGMKSPTILPLKKEGWSSMHSVVNENDFWEKIDLLKSYGAEGILVIPIEKMIL